MAAGNWTPELIELAGGVNLFGEAGRHSPWMSWEELVAADPDVIVIAPCGFDLARTEQELHFLTVAAGLERPAGAQVSWPTATNISIARDRAWCETLASCARCCTRSVRAVAERHCVARVMMSLETWR